MDPATIISLLSLLIAILAMPASYWIAVRQVRVGVKEQEHRLKMQSRLQVANCIDEFFKVFYYAVKYHTGIEPRDLQRRLKDIDPQIKEIDDFVMKTQVLGRLASAIDNMNAISFSNSQQSLTLLEKLQSVRNQIALGSDTTRYATLGVIKAIEGAELSTTLREN